MLQAKIRAIAERGREKARLAYAAEQEEQAAWLAQHPGGCAACRNSGLVSPSETCAHCPRGAAKRYQQEQERIRELWALAQIPPRQRTRTLDGYPSKQLDAYASVCEFLATWDGKMGLVITGHPARNGSYSTGKTGLMVGLMREIAPLYVGTRHQLRFVTSVELMAALRPTNRDEQERSTLMEKLMRVRLLAIDDLGKDKPTDWVLEQLFILINHRTDHELPTFVTTNYSAEQLIDRIGEGPADRLLQAGLLIEMDEDAPNLRTGAGAERATTRGGA